MPDFNDQFSRFMDQFQQGSRADARNNEEIATTLRELLEKQEEMHQYQVAQDRLRKSGKREDDIENERSRKIVEGHQEKVEKGDTKTGSILGEMLSLFKSPAILGAAIGLAFADSLTKVNLRETLFAGTILSKVGGTSLLKGMEKIATAGPRGIGAAGRALSRTGAAGVVGGAMRGVGAAGGGIFATIKGLIKPFLSLLKPVMSVVKLFAKASIVLTPVIAIIEGAMKAFEVFKGGGSIAEVIMGFLLGALESLTIGILEGITTLGNWLVSFVETLPDIIGDIIDGVFDFFANLFGGEASTPIGPNAARLCVQTWECFERRRNNGCKINMGFVQNGPQDFMEIIGSNRRCNMGTW